MNIFRTFRTALLAFATVVFAASIVAAGASDPAQGQDPPVGNPHISNVPDDLSVKPQTYTNINEDFQIEFPGGCGMLVTRANEPDLFEGEEWDDIVQVTNVYCDRYQTTGEGCSVIATFNLHGENGSVAGPQNVFSRVKVALKHFQAQAVKQRAISKQFENGILLEGVEVLAKPEGGTGEVWIWGLLVQGDIYILTAWNKDGGLWDDPEYHTFFKSFQPWVD